MVNIRIIVDGGPKGRRVLTNGPIPMDMFNRLGLIVLTPWPEPVRDARALGVTFTPQTDGAQFVVHPGETLSFEVSEE